MSSLAVGTPASLSYGIRAKHGKKATHTDYGGGNPPPVTPNAVA